MKHILWTGIVSVGLLVAVLVSSRQGASANERVPEQLSYVESSIGLIPPNLEGGDTELEMGDVNADGNPDLVSIGDHYGGIVEEQGIMVWFGDGSGGNWNWQHYGSGFGYGGIALGDINNDGLMDVGYAMHHNYDGALGDQLIEAALGDGSGLFWTPWDVGLATNGEDYGMFGTDFADVDNDGDLDIGAVSFGYGQGVHVYLNQGDGSWVQSFGFFGGNADNEFTFGDVNADGKADLAVNHEDGLVYLGDGSGGFNLGQGNLPYAGSVTSVALGEVNQDGGDELGLVNTSGGVQVWDWVSAGQWQNISGALPTSGPYEKVQLFDMNMDGNGDVVAFGSGSLKVWTGDGTGSWSEAAHFTTPSPGYASAFRVGGDMDHNGYPDIVLVSDEGSWPSDHNHLHFYKEASLPQVLAITPVAPSGGESFYAGGVTFLDWISSVPVGEVGSVSLELSLHGENGPWQQIAAGLPNNGRFQWRIPSTTPSTSEAMIRYTLETGSGTAVGITPAPFIILGITEEPISGLSAANDSPSVLGETTVLSATVISGTNVVYAWELGDGATAVGALTGHVYPSTGVYTATVTASNDVSSESAATRVVIVEPPHWELWLPLVFETH